MFVRACVFVFIHLFLCTRPFGTDLAEAKAVAGRSTFAAVLGLVGPIGFAFLLMSVGYGKSWQASLAVGAAIAPTSVGFSAKLFMEVGHMDTPLARVACSAAVIDDVLSLVLLSGEVAPL